MIKRLLAVLTLTALVMAAYSVSAEEKKVDADSSQHKEVEKHTHPKDAKGVPQGDAKDSKDGENKTGDKKHFHPRDGK